MKLSEIAGFLGGEIIRGDPELEIIGVSGLTGAKQGDITFLAGRKYLNLLKATKASCVIVKEPIDAPGMAQLKVAEPYYAFARLLSLFYEKPRKPIGISKDAFVPENVSIGEDVSIYPLAYISEGAGIGRGTIIYPSVFIGEGVRIGEDCIIYPNVVLREGVSVGNRVIIHSGSVIGSDGFGYTPHEGRHYKIPQVGGVIIEDDVEIGANVTVDRATTGNTLLGKGTKIDNLVQVGHNVQIQEGSIIVAQVAIGGSSEIGRFVTIGGQTGISDHASIEDGTMIAAQSGVMPGRLQKGVYSGSPVMPHMLWLKASAIFKRLPELMEKIKLLEEKIEKLERRSNGD